ANEKACADPWKKQKMDDLVLMLQGAMTAEGKVGLMMNVRKADLAAVLKVLPALQKPTVSSLSDPEWVDVLTIIDENTVRHIGPQLKGGGARAIVDYPLNKIIDGAANSAPPKTSAGKPSVIFLKPRPRLPSRIRR